jgi:hypothetical protein
VILNWQQRTELGNTARLLLVSMISAAMPQTSRHEVCCSIVNIVKESNMHFDYDCKRNIYQHLTKERLRPRYVYSVSSK